jgi:predicted TPR repeat methyltransferase
MMVTLDLNALDLQDGQRVLDLGCGRGRHSHAFYWHDKALDVTMLDLSLEDLKGRDRRLFRAAPAAADPASQRGVVRRRCRAPALCRQQL